MIIMQDIDYCKKKVKEIDEWLNNYDGDNDALIEKKLNEQEKCLKVISSHRNALSKQKW